MGGGRDQPPVGGHRGRGQARDGVNLVLLVSLVGWVCSSSAKKEAKNSAATLTVDSRHTVLGPDEKLAGGRAQRVDAGPTDRAPRLGPSARGPRRRAAPGAHDAPPRGAEAPPRSRWFGTKNTRRQGWGWSLGTLEACLMQYVRCFRLYVSANSAALPMSHWRYELRITYPYYASLSRACTWEG